MGPQPTKIHPSLIPGFSELKNRTRILIVIPAKSELHPQNQNRSVPPRHWEILHPR